MSRLELAFKNCIKFYALVGCTVYTVRTRMLVDVIQTFNKRLKASYTKKTSKSILASTKTTPKYVRYTLYRQLLLTSELGEEISYSSWL